MASEGRANTGLGYQRGLCTLHIRQGKVDHLELLRFIY